MQPPAGQLFDESLRATRRVSWLVGVDEAGRGPLAGPLVAAAVRLGPDVGEGLWEARDSKLLPPAKREELFQAIRSHAEAVSGRMECLPCVDHPSLGVAVAWAHVGEIERSNILAATLKAMRRAVMRAALGAAAKSCLVVVDGNRRIPELPLEQLTVVEGDRLSLAVSCASIVAKVVRDRWMVSLDRRYPGYGLARHKGYATPEHRALLKRLGPTPIHRRTFKPVGQMTFL